MKIKFKHIEIGQAVLYNDRYARKLDANRLVIPSLGVNGFLYFEEEETLEIEETDNESEKTNN